MRRNNKFKENILINIMWKNNKLNSEFWILNEEIFNLVLFVLIFIKKCTLFTFIVWEDEIVHDCPFNSIKNLSKYICFEKKDYQLSRNLFYHDRS
jgi:hypothetical protein